MLTWLFVAIIRRGCCIGCVSACLRSSAGRDFALAVREAETTEGAHNDGFITKHQKGCLYMFAHLILSSREW